MREFVAEQFRSRTDSDRGEHIASAARLGIRSRVVLATARDPSNARVLSGYQNRPPGSIYRERRRGSRVVIEILQTTGTVSACMVVADGASTELCGGLELIDRLGSGAGAPESRPPASRAGLGTRGTSTQPMSGGHTHVV